MNELVWTDKVRIQVAADQVSVDLDGEATILNLESGTYFGLNLVGAQIWGLVKEAPRTFGQIRQTILDQYDVTFEQCDGDLRELLGQLHEHGLIGIVDEASR